MLFGAMHISQKFSPEFYDYANKFGIEAVPIIYKGRIKNSLELLTLLERESILGGTTIEGVVVKNYNKPFLLGGQPIPIMAGKFVSEKFKEVNSERWDKEEKTKSRLDMFMESFRTEARWGKAVQHLKDSDKLSNEPKDIGLLIKEIQVDIETEEADNIKGWLWGEFKGQVMRRAVAGMPEWYKEQLLKGSFENKR